MNAHILWLHGSEGCLATTYEWNSTSMRRFKTFSKKGGKKKAINLLKERRRSMWW